MEDIETEDVAANNMAAVAAMNAQRIGEQEGNRTYKGEVNRYKRWVEQNDPDRSRFGIPPSKHISVDALASYYLEVHALRAVQTKTAMKSIYALNQLAMKEQATHVLGGERNSIEFGPAGTAITAALKSIRANYVRKKSAEDDQCPHDKLPTNIISQEQQSIVLSMVLSRHDSGWADTASTWATVANTLIRFESIKKIRLNKLKVLNDLPPHGIETPHDTETWESVRKKTDGRILGIIIPLCDQIKKMKTRDCLKPEAVGGYRHQRYERCYHGIIGFVLLERLNDGQLISLKKRHVLLMEIRTGRMSRSSTTNTTQQERHSKGQESWHKLMIG